MRKFTNAIGIYCANAQIKKRKFTRGELTRFQLVWAQSETSLYVKFYPSLGGNWLGINPTGATFLEMVAVYVNINKYGYVG